MQEMNLITERKIVELFFCYLEIMLVILIHSVFFLVDSLYLFHSMQQRDMPQP